MAFFTDSVTEGGNSLSSPFKRTDFPYAHCFCEENIYKVAESLMVSSESQLTRYYVIFISSEGKTTPLWCQKSSPDPDKTVVWDYHVVLLQVDADSKGNPLILDHDTTLDFPCMALQYMLQSIQPNRNIARSFQQ